MHVLAFFDVGSSPERITLFRFRFDQRKSGMVFRFFVYFIYSRTRRAVGDGVGKAKGGDRSRCEITPGIYGQKSDDETFPFGQRNTLSEKDGDAVSFGVTL